MRRYRKGCVHVHFIRGTITIFRLEVFLNGSEEFIGVDAFISVVDSVVGTSSVGGRIDKGCCLVCLSLGQCGCCLTFSEVWILHH